MWRNACPIINCLFPSQSVCLSGKSGTQCRLDSHWTQWPIQCWAFHQHGNELWTRSSHFMVHEYQWNVDATPKENYKRQPYTTPQWHDMRYTESVNYTALEMIYYCDDGWSFPVQTSIQSSFVDALLNKWVPGHNLQRFQGNLIITM